VSTENQIVVNALNRNYFNSTKNYTLSLLNAFNNIYYYTYNQETQQDYGYKIPITFGNYEKSIILEDVDNEQLKTGNINILPRLVLTFNGMTRVTERSSQKFQRFKKKVYLENPEGDGKDKLVLDTSFNSIPYDFEFTLLLQARGLSMGTQITEQILSYFNPTLSLKI
jgi:hypothetical protein